MSAGLTVTRDGPVARFTLDRPGRGNALDAALVEALLAAVEEALAAQARLLVFAGAGRNFCTGFDLGGLEEARDGDLVLRLLRIETLLQTIHHAPVPTLALVHGNALGAGADLVVACQHRIAAPDARFAFPGTRFGIALGSRRLALRVGPDAARRLLVAEAPLPAASAQALGLVGALAAPTDWEAQLAELRDEAEARDPGVVALLHRRTLPDSRAEDMAALVESLTAGSLKARIQAYAAARKG